MWTSFSSENFLKWNYFPYPYCSVWPTLKTSLKRPFFSQQSCCIRWALKQAMWTEQIWLGSWDILRLPEGSPLNPVSSFRLLSQSIKNVEQGGTGVKMIQTVPMWAEYKAKRSSHHWFCLLHFSKWGGLVGSVLAIISIYNKYIAIYSSIITFMVHSIRKCAASCHTIF